MDNRLVIIEGLPCSGKSTASRFVADTLAQRGRVCFVDEGSGSHPADIEFHAYLSDAVLTQFDDSERCQIQTCSERCMNGWLVPLGHFDGELQTRLLKYKVYDMLPWEEERPVMLEKWRRFVSSAAGDTTYVFNCVLLQNPMCETMMRFGFDESTSFGFISEIAGIIAPMQPLVIYLRNDDIAECVQRASAERDGWLDAVVDYHVNGAYGRSIGASGFDGYIRCLDERQRRELAMLSRIPVRSIVADNPHRDWTSAYKQIKKHL